MEFLTLHELSVQLDTSVRVLRERLHKLVRAGKLAEGRDCRRDNFVDDTHFTWRVEPIAFMRETGLQLVTTPANPALRTVNKQDDQPTHRVTEPPHIPAETLPKVDNASSSMEREMIDLLKEQVSVKDRQISNLTDQNQKLNDLNVKLVGQSVHQMQRIETLMRLTGGKVDLANAGENDGRESSPRVGIADGDSASEAAA